VSSLALIPFNRPAVVGNELLNISQAIDKGHISGSGSFTLEAERLLSAVSGSENVLMTSSCTHALELAARVLNLGPGDEVIVPAYTFVSSASAFALTGAKPVFVDVDPLTLNLDSALVEEAITERTKAVCTVHYAGIAMDIDRLAELCRKSGIPLIEDNAHGLSGSFNGQLLGTFGALSTLSFHETKNITCGEGGALAINQRQLLDRAEILREKGTDRSKFLRGQVDKYTWVGLGSSWVASDMLAAFLVAQLESFETIQQSRTRTWNTYDAELRDWAAQNGVRLPHVPSNSKHPAHMFYLQFEDVDTRTAYISHLKKAGIMAVFHYQALNCSKVGIELGGVPGSCPVSEHAAQTLVRLPLFHDITDFERERIISASTSFTWR
jgi:dTDP-4-amino-4,6-dideoxygalactose transaminase